MSCLLTTSLPRLQGRWNFTGQNGFQHPAVNIEHSLPEYTQSLTTRGCSGFFAENTNGLLGLGNFILKNILFNLTQLIDSLDRYSHLESGLPYDTLLVGDALGKLYTELVCLYLRADRSQVSQVVIPDFSAEQTFQPALCL